MANQEFSPEESLRIIQQMISKTRDDLSEQRTYFLVWGWATLAACLGQFVLKAIVDYRHHYLVWLIVFPCIIFSVVYGVRQDRKQRVKTYVSENMEMLWSGVAISFLVLVAIFFKIGWQNCYPFYMMMYGLGSFVSGRILQFRPFILGGIASWILAVVAIWFTFDYQNLFAGAAILFSYIIPGHLLQRDSQSTGSEISNLKSTQDGR